MTRSHQCLMLFRCLRSKRVCLSVSTNNTESEVGLTSKVPFSILECLQQSLHSPKDKQWPCLPMLRRNKSNDQQGHPEPDRFGNFPVLWRTFCLRCAYIYVRQVPRSGGKLKDMHSRLSCAFALTALAWCAALSAPTPAAGDGAATVVLLGAATAFFAGILIIIHRVAAAPSITDPPSTAGVAPSWSRHLLILQFATTVATSLLLLWVKLQKPHYYICHHLDLSLLI